GMGSVAAGAGYRSAAGLAMPLDTGSARPRGFLRFASARHRHSAGAGRTSPAPVPGSAGAVCAGGRMTPAADFLTARQLGRLLLILAACAAPQALHIAPWISGIALLLGMWRYLGAVRGWRLQFRTLRLLLALAGFVGVFASYGSINGVQAGSALLVLMLALKLTESWRRRDCALLAVLGFFLIGAEFLYEQRILTTLYMLPVLWLLTAELLAVTHPGTPLAFRTALTTSGRLLLLAVPLMLIMYLLFPRIPGPLWGIGDARGAGVSGLDDSMTPGSIGELALSD